MKSINLLPRKPWHEKYFVSLCVLLILVLATPLALMMQGAIDGTKELERLTLQLEQKEAEVAQLHRLKSADDFAIAYDQLYAAIEQAKFNRIDWPDLFSAIVTPLPTTASLRLAESEKEGELSLNLRFHSYEQIDRYADQLNQSERFEVRLQTVKHETGNVTESAPYFAVTIKLTLKQIEQKAANA